MSSAECEQAVRDAIRCRRAVLKFISPNDVGLTGGHQCGYYLPKQAWRLFTRFKPTNGVNNDHRVEAVWPDGQVTQSVVKWYGVGTRSEYRMTRFGRNFPYLSEDCVGSLLVLIPERIDRFLMYVFDLEDDIENIQATLGVTTVKGWAVFDRDKPELWESEDACMDRHFRRFVEVLTDFPPTLAFADESWRTLIDCIKTFTAQPSDDQLMMCVGAEYRLFQLAGAQNMRARDCAGLQIRR